MSVGFDGIPSADNPRIGELIVQRSRRRNVGQALGFVASNLGVQALGAVATTILARTLSVRAFGSYAFVTSALVFLAMFFEFGLFVPASRMAARSDPEEGRRLFAASLLAYIPVGLTFGLAVVALSYCTDRVFHVQAGHPLRLVAPLAVAIPFELVGQQFAQGLDRLHVFSISAVVGRMLFLAMALTLLAVARLSITTALAAEYAGMLLGWVLLIRWLRPSVTGVRSRIGSLVAGARSFGFALYVGRVMSVGTYNMDVLMVAAFTDARSVSYYALAGAIASPVGLPSSALAAALFPRMANEDNVERRWLGWAIAIGLAGALGATILVRPFVHLVLSDRYLPVAALVLPLALASAVRGVTTLFNSFLTAHARGKELRNAAVVLTVSNVALNFALIPPFGAMGAAWASLVALIANLIVHVISYQRTVGAPQPA